MKGAERSADVAGSVPRFLIVVSFFVEHVIR
jgi:hypothetical protein